MHWHARLTFTLAQDGARQGKPSLSHTGFPALNPVLLSAACDTAGVAAAQSISSWSRVETPVHWQAAWQRPCTALQRHQAAVPRQGMQPMQVLPKPRAQWQSLPVPCARRQNAGVKGAALAQGAGGACELVQGDFARQMARGPLRFRRAGREIECLSGRLFDSAKQRRIAGIRAAAAAADAAAAIPYSAHGRHGVPYMPSPWMPPVPMQQSGACVCLG